MLWDGSPRKVHGMDLTPLDVSALDPWLLAAAALAVVVLLVGLLLLVRRTRRRRALRRRYGAEYDHTARRAGSRRGADRQLLAREAERRRYQVRDLEEGERERLRSRWEALQASFVDDPVEATRRGDAMVLEVAAAKGYPTTGDDPLAGVGIDHPRALDRYRTVCEDRDERTRAGIDTERARAILLATRDLFETLVGTGATAGEDTRSAFRDLVDDDPTAELVPEPAPPFESTSPARDATGDDEDAGLPLYGPDGRPVWGDHAEHRR